MLRCKACQNLRVNADFYTYRNGRPHQPCKACRSADAKARYQDDPAHFAVLTRRQRLKIYGLTVGDYERILTEQHGRCAICRTGDPGHTRAFHVDHDARTGAVRGLLCSKCNRGLGHYDDSPARLRAAADYLAAANDYRSTRPLFI
jgi:hypothetical protein